jgi:hypothetical protein
MQKQLDRVGRASGRSTSKGIQKKNAAKKLAPNKRASRKPVHGSKRTGITRHFSALSTWEKQMYALDAAGTDVTDVLTTAIKGSANLVSCDSLTLQDHCAPAVGTTNPDTRVTLATVTESSMGLDSSNQLIPQENLDRSLSASGTVVPDNPMTATRNTGPSSLIVPREHVTYILNAAGPAIRRGSMATPRRYSSAPRRHAGFLPPIITSLFGWRTYRKRVQEKRAVLQMLVVNGSVRPGSVEFRYSADPEETGTLCRSFAVSPASDDRPPSALHALSMRLLGRGMHLVQSMHLPERCAHLQSRSLQLFDWLRRELTTRSYPSRV